MREGERVGETGQARGRPQLGAWSFPAKALEPARPCLIHTAPPSMPQGVEGAWSFLCVVFPAKFRCAPGLVFPQKFPGSSIC